MLDWLPVESSALSAAAYDPGKRQLYLRFRSGELYCYLDLPPDVYSQFLAADSKGKFFGLRIRDQFACEHLPRARGASSGSS